jgi:hypothetical protein
MKKQNAHPEKNPLKKFGREAASGINRMITNPIPGKKLRKSRSAAQFKLVFDEPVIGTFHGCKVSVCSRFGHSPVFKHDNVCLHAALC